MVCLIVAAILFSWIRSPRQIKVDWWKEPKLIPALSFCGGDWFFQQIQANPVFNSTLEFGAGDYACFKSILTNSESVEDNKHAVLSVLSTQTPVNQAIYDALTVLQHRGQDAAGIVTIDDETASVWRKANGLVSDAFQQEHMLRLAGNTGIGHVRYPTAGVLQRLRKRSRFM